MPQELELKLDVSADAIETLKSNPSFRHQMKGAGVKRELVSVYLDTKDFALRRQGFSFRLRRDGDRLIQTIKGMRCGVLERAEWETSSLAGDRRQVDAEWPYLAGDRDHHVAMENLLKQLSDQKLPTALRAIFRTKVERTSYRVGGIEVSLDKGRIIAGHQSAPVCEIELELKDGDRAALFTLAREISQIVPAEISVKSKAERGYDLITRSKSGAVMAAKIVLPPSVTAAATFHIVCNACLCQLIANKAGVRASVAEAFHQMRVALTRFDAAMKLFSGIASGLQAQHLAKELKWIGDELSLARDLDVFLTDVLVPLKKRHPIDINVAAFHRACLQKRKKEYERANAALGSERFRVLLLTAVEWVEAGQWQQEKGKKSELKRRQLAKEVVADRLWALMKKMEEGRQIEELDPRSLHKFRLRAKQMRYTIEFAKGLFDDQQSRNHIETALTNLKVLQSALGELSDITARKAIFDRIAVDRTNRKKRQQPAQSRVARLMFGNQKRRTRQLLMKSGEAYEEIRHTKPFWM